MPRVATAPKVPSEVVGAPVDKVREALLRWYDAHARDLPWRVSPALRRAGVTPDPYRVWLSEVMLQQTTVAAVRPYFAKFLAAFPTVEALAAAPQDDVLRLWAGLGYYSRARNLHAAARIAASAGLPADEAGWRRLPGVGAYTAAAIAAIAHDRPANAVDGNVERVMARLHAVETPLPAAKKELAALAADYVRPERAGDWLQALMDLGATVCLPRAPACAVCPLAELCRAAALGAAASFPRRTAKSPRPKRFGACFALVVAGEALLVRRAPDGLLGGMLALPSTDWGSEPLPAPTRFAPAPAAWRRAGAVRHVFTHFELELEVWAAEGAVRPDGEWRRLDALAEAGLPTVFAKAAALARQAI